jgi:UDP-N-acetylglucosamine 2-epimerase
VVFHPDPSENVEAADICRHILLELKHAGLGAYVGYPNTDAANKNIIAVFSEFADEPRFRFYRTLERNRFIAVYRKARFIIGNSSSGIIEAASIPIPAINVGLRQRGRLAGRNVIFVNADAHELCSSLRSGKEHGFRATAAQNGGCPPSGGHCPTRDRHERGPSGGQVSVSADAGRLNCCGV